MTPDRRASRPSRRTSVPAVARDGRPLPPLRQPIVGRCRSRRPGAGAEGFQEHDVRRLGDEVLVAIGGGAASGPFQSSLELHRVTAEDDDVAQGQQLGEMADHEVRLAKEGGTAHPTTQCGEIHFDAALHRFRRVERAREFRDLDRPESPRSARATALFPVPGVPVDATGLGTWSLLRRTGGRGRCGARRAPRRRRAPCGSRPERGARRVGACRRG